MIIVSISAGDAVAPSRRAARRCDVANGDDIFQLESGEVGERVVEAHFVALERLQGLVGAIEQPADVLQLMLAPAGVDVDDAHLFADADHGTGSDRATRSAVRCRVPVSTCRHRRVGHEVDVGPAIRRWSGNRG